MKTSEIEKRLRELEAQQEQLRLELESARKREEEHSKVTFLHTNAYYHSSNEKWVARWNHKPYGLKHIATVQTKEDAVEIARNANDIAMWVLSFYDPPTSD